MSTATFAVQQNRIYGARELKEIIGKNTLRSFGYAMGSLLLLMLCWYFYNLYLQRSLALKANIPVVKISLSDLPPPPTDEAPPPPPTNMTVTAPAVAGTPIPVPETMLTPDMKEFANVEDLTKSTSTPTEGITPGTDVQIDAGTQVVKEDEPAPDEFISYEKDASFDLLDLQRRVQYPEIARRQNIEGKVQLRVYISKEGKPIKYIFEQQLNEACDQAAVKAIMSYTGFSPAIMNNIPVGCWISIPVHFKLNK